jgi:hypothetical protein
VGNAAGRGNHSARSAAIGSVRAARKSGWSAARADAPTATVPWAQTYRVPLEMRPGELSGPAPRHRSLRPQIVMYDLVEAR